MLPLIGGTVAGCATTVDPAANDLSVETRIRLAEMAAAGAASDTVAAKQQFIRGMSYEVRGEYDRAIEHYRKALALVPEQPAILMAVAEAHREIDDVQAARYYALQAHEADPDDLMYHRQYADLLLHTGDGEAAINAYQELVERHPDALDALFDFARIQTQMGRLQEALVTYGRLLDLLGEDMEVRTEMLHVYIRLADSDGIISTLESMAKAEPYNSTYLRMLAEAHVQNEDNERAIDLLKKAHDLEPDDFSLVMKLAELYRSTGREEEADRLLTEASEQMQSVEALLAQASAYYARASVDQESGSTAEQLLTRVLTLDPGNADASLMLGSIRFQNGAYADAAEHFETALEVHTDQMQIWFQAAAAHLQAGDAAEAADTAEEGLILFPQQPDLLRIAGYARMESFENERAIAHFDDLLEVLLEDQPDRTELHAEVLSALAMMYDRQQSAAASDSLYGRAILAYPDHSLSLNNYAYSLAERNEKLNEALKMAQRAVELEPENPSYLDTLGWIYFQMENFDEARDWIRKSLDAGSNSAAVHEHYGDVLLKLGQEDEARSYFESARELGGDEDRLQQKLDQVPAN